MELYQPFVVFVRTYMVACDHHMVVNCNVNNNTLVSCSQTALVKAPPPQGGSVQRMPPDSMSGRVV